MAVTGPAAARVARQKDVMSEVRCRRCPVCDVVVEYSRDGDVSDLLGDDSANRDSGRCPDSMAWVPRKMVIGGEGSACSTCAPPICSFFVVDVALETVRERTT